MFNSFNHTIYHYNKWLALWSCCNVSFIFILLFYRYARLYYSSTSIANASFFHIIHNLDDSYEGRIYPDGNDSLSSIHHIPIELLQDPYWHANILNPSRCVLLSTDNWGTVRLIILFWYLLLVLFIKKIFNIILL